MKEDYFSLLFFIRKAKLLKNGEAPVCFRVTVNGKRAEVQLKRSVALKNWSQAKECTIGKDVKSQELNYYMDGIRAKIFSIQRDLQLDDRIITPKLIINIFKGKDESKKTLLEVFNDHNKQCRDLIYKDYALGTVLRYERTVKYLEEFMKKEYHIPDIPLKKIDNTFIRNFEHFVKTQKGCAQNAAIKYLKNLKKITKIALSNHWMTTDPFSNIIFHQTQPNRDFLIEEEIRILINKKFKIERIGIVRDIFLFCCFTGLAFSDVQKLKKEHIFKDDRGEWWIKKPREKTNNMCYIPLLEIPMKLLEKYKNHPKCLEKDVVLPVPSNQRMNSYLTEIADVCGIKKNLTTHIARHSFACIALANKVSIESIAKMLGHTDLKTTRIYAKIMDRTISEEMQALRNKFVI